MRPSLAGLALLLSIGSTGLLASGCASAGATIYTLKIQDPSSDIAQNIILGQLRFTCRVDLSFHAGRNMAGKRAATCARKSSPSSYGLPRKKHSFVYASMLLRPHGTTILQPRVPLPHIIMLLETAGKGFRGEQSLTSDLFGKVSSCQLLDSRYAL